MPIPARFGAGFPLQIVENANIFNSYGGKSNVLNLVLRLDRLKNIASGVVALKKS